MDPKCSLYLVSIVLMLSDKHILNRPSRCLNPCNVCTARGWPGLLQIRVGRPCQQEVTREKLNFVFSYEYYIGVQEATRGHNFISTAQKKFCMCMLMACLRHRICLFPVGLACTPYILPYCTAVLQRILHHARAGAVGTR